MRSGDKESSCEKPTEEVPCQETQRYHTFSRHVKEVDGVNHLVFWNLKNVRGLKFVSVLNFSHILNDK